MQRMNNEEIQFASADFLAENTTLLHENVAHTVQTIVSQDDNNIVVVAKNNNTNESLTLSFETSAIVQILQF